MKKCSGGGHSTVRSHVRGREGVPVQSGPMFGGRGSPYGEVQYIMGTGHIGPRHPVDKMTDAQADRIENTTFPQLCWRVVNIKTVSRIG